MVGHFSLWQTFAMADLRYGGPLPYYRMEVKDKEERRNNVIIFQVPESSDDSPANHIKNHNQSLSEIFLINWSD